MPKEKADILKGLLLWPESALDQGHEAQAGRQVDHKTVARPWYGPKITGSGLQLRRDRGLGDFSGVISALTSLDHYIRALKTGPSRSRRPPFQNVCLGRSEFDKRR